MNLGTDSPEVADLRAQLATRLQALRAELEADEDRIRRLMKPKSGHPLQPK